VRRPGPRPRQSPARAPCGRAPFRRAHGFPASHIAALYRVKVNNPWPLRPQSSRPGQAPASTRTGRHARATFARGDHGAIGARAAARWSASRGCRRPRDRSPDAYVRHPAARTFWLQPAGGGPHAFL
jgi:hypothetical protein